MRYFKDINYLYNQGKYSYKLLDTVLSNNLIEVAMRNIEWYLKYCMTFFVDGDIDKYWQEVSDCKNNEERRKVYNNLLTEVSDEERNRRFKDYLDDDKIVTMNDEIYDVLSDTFIDGFYNELEVYFEDYVWEATHNITE